MLGYLAFLSLLLFEQNIFFAFEVIRYVILQFGSRQPGSYVVDSERT